MKILFVMPSKEKRFTFQVPMLAKNAFPCGIVPWEQKDAPIAPLTFAVLAGLTPKDVEMELVDDRVEDIPSTTDADLVAITADTFSVKRAYDIAALFRRQGIPVILGGMHATFMPDEALGYVDSVVVGEAESLWDEVIADAKNGCLKRIYRMKERPSLVGLRPDRSIYSGKHYAPIALVETGRGCWHRCEFCAINQFFSYSVRHRPIPDVIREIAELRHKKLIFVDDNITCDIPWAKRFFRELVPLKVRWGGQASIKVASDGELLYLMRKSGCFTLFIGLETLSKKTLDLMGKSWATESFQYEEAIRTIHQAGINIEANFVCGYPDDDARTLEDILIFAKQQNFMSVQFFPLAPLPGTPCYLDLEKNGQLRFGKWWLELKDLLHEGAVYVPQGMDAHQLVKGCLDIQRSEEHTSELQSH